MNKDAELIAEAYLKVLEEKSKSKKNDHNKDGKKDFNDVKIARMVASGMSKDEAIAKVGGKKKKSMQKENEEMSQAYETILEFKQINKKFARRYNKVTAAMLKAQPGSEEYGALKTEREDLVTILRDHDQTPKDLEAFLVKKEKSNPLPDVQDPQTANQYRDSSYTDTADIPQEGDDYEPSMHDSQSEVAQMPPDAPTSHEIRAAAQQ